MQHILKVIAIASAVLVVFLAIPLGNQPSWVREVIGKLSLDAFVIPALAQGPAMPVADAGRDQSATLGQDVVLDGSDSTDLDGNQLTYSWALNAPASSTAVLSEVSVVRPSFQVGQTGDYVAQLIVNDGAQTVSLPALSSALTMLPQSLAPVLTERLQLGPLC